MNNKRLKMLGINIKTERLKQSVSQEKLSEMINISLASMSLIETGKQNTSFLNILDISRALNIDIQNLSKDV
ncbi:MAG: helix-turn-helix transcriptional regulator [Candidatus Gastranaerophilales bacterium]